MPNDMFALSSAVETYIKSRAIAIAYTENRSQRYAWQQLEGNIPFLALSKEFFFFNHGHILKLIDFNILFYLIRIMIEYLINIFVK